MRLAACWSRCSSATIRSRFEVFGYALKPGDDSVIGQRVVAACEHFIDVAQWPLARIAERMRADGIDVLIDLNGHTKGARAGLVAAAPGAGDCELSRLSRHDGHDFVDYIIGDAIVIPPGTEDEFSEAVVRLPVCYQPNDSQREVGVPTQRAEHGLPENISTERAIVACSFNQSWKFTPSIWAIWMDLLKAHPRVVLWLLDENPWATENLRAHAAALGLEHARLIFAPRLPHPQHLARLALADIAFDPAPCTSHTTGSDALRMGVPLVTLEGHSFDARVGASLLHAVGLPELVTRSEAEYAAKLAALIDAPAQLAALKASLLERCGSAALFDSAATTRALERAYVAMYARFRAGHAPAAIDLRAGRANELEV